MQTFSEESSRVETVTAALIYLMTHYMRTGCPQLAVCISRHMQCLALHPGADRVVRDTCAALHGFWEPEVPASAAAALSHQRKTLLQ